eukprot:259460_1
MPQTRGGPQDVRVADRPTAIMKRPGGIAKAPAASGSTRPAPPTKSAWAGGKPSIPKHATLSTPPSNGWTPVKPERSGYRFGSQSLAGSLRFGAAPTTDRFGSPSRTSDASDTSSRFPARSTSPTSGGEKGGEG